MSVLPAVISVTLMCLVPAEGVGSPGSGATNDFELPCEFLEPILGSLE